MATGDAHTRRLRAVAIAAMVFPVAGLLVVGAAFLAHLWGFLLARWQLEALLAVSLEQAIGLAVLGAVVVWLRPARAVKVGPLWPKVALAVLPIIAVICGDRAATVFYRPIHETVGMLENEPTRLWTTRPNWRERRGDVSYRINGAGLRGPDLPLEKRDGERRVLFLGDSITFGVGVNEEDCFVWQVEKLANEPGDPDNPETNDNGPRLTTVVNCSVIGYSPWQEYDLLREVGLAYDPDLIVQVFCLNDFGQKYNLVQYGGSTRDLAPPDPSALEWSGLFRMARALSYQWFGPTRDELEARDEAYLPERFMDEPEAPYIREAVATTFAALDKIVSVAKARGIPIAVVCFPHARQVDPGASIAADEKLRNPQRKLSEFCRERGVPFLDLIAAYRAHGPETGHKGEHLFPDGTHPTPEANRVAAKAIHAFLLERGLLD